MGDKKLVGGEPTEEREGGVLPGGEGGNEQIFGSWCGFPASPISRENSACSHMCMIYVLFYDHKPLIMYQSNYYQK